MLLNSTICFVNLLQNVAKFVAGCSIHECRGRVSGQHQDGSLVRGRGSRKGALFSPAGEEQGHERGAGNGDCFVSGENKCV